MFNLAFEVSSYLFVNGAEIHKFKAKDSETLATPLCLGNISKEFSEDNMKKTGLYGYVYDFSVDYDAIVVTEWDSIKCLNIFKKMFVVAMTPFSCNALECVLMNNQECKIRPQVVNINSGNPFLSLQYSGK